jgi:hypothetical protein
VERLLLTSGATADETARIVDALGQAGLIPPRMRTWLMYPDRSYSVDIGRKLLDVEWKAAPVEALELGHASAVVAAAEEFADASSDERFIALTCPCDLDAVRRALLTGCWTSAWTSRFKPSRTASLTRSSFVRRARCSTSGGRQCGLVAQRPVAVVEARVRRVVTAIATALRSSAAARPLVAWAATVTAPTCGAL